MPEVITAENLRELPGIRHGFFTRAWGDCGLLIKKDGGASLANRARVAAHLSAAPEKLMSCFQTHSADVITVTQIWPVENRPHADAMVTKEKGIALGVQTADCVPLLFADKNAGVIGAAHAGWRGALTGIIENTLNAMEKLGANKKAIRAALGPCIWQNSYEVGPEFPAPFLAENPNYAKFFKPAFKSDHTMFNLPGYVEDKLRAVGVMSIESSPADTLADEARFFSYRRACLQDKDRGGSLISVIVLSD